LDLRTLSLKKRDQGKIAFKQFEYTLLKVLAIHKAYPGTCLIEKFLSELIKKKRERLDGQEIVNSIEERLLLSFGEVEFVKKIDTPKV
jgi:hypothetical protein